MDMTLTRNPGDFLPSGIFGVLSSQDNSLELATLEHAYLQPDASWAPKIPVGTYTCVRGLHRLDGMTSDFETFEITNVQGHTNILFHTGNYNNDSAGCVLVGLQQVNNVKIIGSRIAFGQFLALQAGVDQFNLTVI